MSHMARGPSQLTRQMLARAAIRERRLPNRLPERASGGPGRGNVCAICCLPIDSPEVEFELTFSAQDGQRPHARFTVHLPCFSVWENELMKGASSASLP